MNGLNIGIGLEMRILVIWVQSYLYALYIGFNVENTGLGNFDDKVFPPIL